MSCRCVDMDIAKQVVALVYGKGQPDLFELKEVKYDLSALRAANRLTTAPDSFEEAIEFLLYCIGFVELEHVSNIGCELSQEHGQKVVYINGISAIYPKWERIDYGKPLTTYEETFVKVMGHGLYPCVHKVL